MLKQTRLQWTSAIGFLMAFSTAAGAQVTSVNGQIAYAACDYSQEVGQNTCDIWVMNADGSDQTNLTNTPALNEAGPSWSPDGTKIAFVEGLTGLNRLMVMNADGTGQVVVTATPSYQFGPTWSAGGTELAFVRQVPGQVMSIQFDILVINVDGTGERNLTSSDFDELDPAWSPDGARIAFAGVRMEKTVDPITGEPVDAAQWEIVTVNPDGSGEAILSAGDAGTQRALRLEEDRAPAWSPDGSRLVFMSQSVDPCCPPWQIWTVNRDGSGAALLSENPAFNDLAPSFSPDGTLILFTSDRDATTGGQFDVYTMPAPPGSAAAAPRDTAMSSAGTPTAASATRLTTSGNAGDPSWGRKPGTQPPRSFTLFVTLNLRGLALGGVGSLPAGIQCGRDCSQAYPAGTRVLLFPRSWIGSRFAGWSGDCAGSGFFCVLTMNDVKSAGATFVRVRR